MKKIVYPSDPFERLVKVDVEDSSKGRFQFDETYPYLDDSFRYKLGRVCNMLFMRLIARPVVFFQVGLKIEGREILKKYKSELKGGAITICNHCYYQDAVFVRYARNKFMDMYMPSYPKHFNNPLFYMMIHGLGGIPIAENMAGMRLFNNAFDTLHERGKWIHVFPEEVRWNWYPYIRPFRKGAFTWAYKYKAPIVPFVIEFRERKGIHLLFGPKDRPCATIHVCEPVFPDMTNSRKVEVDRLRVVCHKEMVDKLGLKDNPWPAIPADEANQNQ